MYNLPLSSLQATVQGKGPLFCLLSPTALQIFLLDEIPSLFSCRHTYVKIFNCLY